MDVETADRLLPQKLFCGNRMTALFFSTPFTSYPHRLKAASADVGGGSGCDNMMFTVADDIVLLMPLDRTPDQAEAQQSFLAPCCLTRKSSSVIRSADQFAVVFVHDIPRWQSGRFYAVCTTLSIRQNDICTHSMTCRCLTSTL